MRIDAHIHYTPPSLAADLDAFIQQEPFWGLMLAPVSGGKSLQGWATAERMIADMDAAGLDKVVLMGEHRRTHSGCVTRNDQALEMLRRWPERVIAFAMIQPKAGQAALEELARCLEGGMRGVGELGPYGQGYRLDDPDFLRLAEACIRHDIPLNLHSNEEVGHYYPGKATTPLRDTYRLASRYPELKLILAHWGGGLFFYELMPEVRRVLGNVWYDTAASPLLYPTRDIFDVALRCVDHGKLLYASDYPLRLYPRRQPEPDFRPFLAEIDALGLSPDLQADILGGNAARLLGLAKAKPRAVTAHAAKLPRPAQVVTEATRGPGASIAAAMSTAVVAEAWPETRVIFARYGIPCDDSPVPFWEPINQAAAARGLGPDALARLVAELNEAICAPSTSECPLHLLRSDSCIVSPVSVKSCTV
jgi:predicted TIM-barrel fold metal-dependent hydrolase